MSDIGMGYGEMQVANLCKGYGIGPLHKEVIKDCSFTLEKSKLTVLIGPSGCGKSALINMLAGYETPDAGSILIDGGKVSGPGPDRLVVFQETALFPWMTVFENVSYGPRVRGELSGKDLENTTMKLLEMVGLEDFRSQVPLAALGRYAAPRRTGPRHDQPAEGHDDGRTLPRSGRHDPRPHAGILRAPF